MSIESVATALVLLISQRSCSVPRKSTSPRCKTMSTCSSSLPEDAVVNFESEERDAMVEINRRPGGLPPIYLGRDAYFQMEIVQ